MNNAFFSEDLVRTQTGHAASGSRSGSRLLRRTFVIAFLLVSGGLLTSGAVELFFRYRESVEGIGALQREMAQGAAFKIQQFVQDIEKTMRASTQTSDIVAAGLTEAYRFQLSKLLKVTPAITTATVSTGTQPARSLSGMAARLAGVSMVLGRTQLTVIPLAWSSRARAWVKAITPALATV